MYVLATQSKSDTMKEQIKCPSCSKLNGTDYNFCIYCGEKLPSPNENISTSKDIPKPELIRCPSCNSPNHKDNAECEECGCKLTSSVENVYCLNCGRLVKNGKAKCECGYNFKDITCPHCSTSNAYTNKSCKSCGKTLWNTHETFQNIVPKGCTCEDTLLLNTKFLKAELQKEPYQRNGKIYAKTLQSKLFEQVKIIREINTRWWIVSASTCKSCKSEINPFKEACPNCGIAHNHNIYDRINELRAGETYIETKRGHELSNLKWNYKLSESDLEEYIKSLAPMPEESQLQYRQRLFKEYRENSAILYLIKSEWNIYFEEYCMNCGCELEQYALYCPQCNTRKEVTALTAIFDNNCVTEAFPGQYHAFCQNMELLCTDNGGDVISSHTGVVGCPNCSNYFNYLNPEFVESHLCPHCGTHFEIIAEIYDSPQQSDESYEMWEMDGITRDEWERRMFEEMDRRNEEYVAHWREFWGD